MIPEVESAVENMLHEFSNYTHYHAPANLDAADSSKPGRLVKRDSGTPYWLENIRHQGTSAFGPGGYTVFRNVKEYGATGTWFDPRADDVQAVQY